MKKIILLIAFLLPAIFCFSQIDSLDIKIGQMIMVGMSGQSAKKNSAIIKDIKKGIVGGVLLFEYNINPKNSQENLLELTNDLQEAAQIPLFISIDQEGGQVNRLKMKYGFVLREDEYYKVNLYIQSNQEIIKKAQEVNLENVNIIHIDSNGKNVIHSINIKENKILIENNNQKIKYNLCKINKSK
jgi:hypothetical protein